MINSTSLKKWIYPLVSFCLVMLILGFYFKGLITDPNNHAPTFGGDGLVIHYNLQYHATHGEGTHLASQYYPQGETIFMTAAQGMLAIALAKLKPVFPGIEDYAVGITGILNFWSNAIGALLLFLALGKLKVKPVLAVLFSVLIALLAPQIIRQTCGHYSLSYAFIIPAILLYLLETRFSYSYYIKSLGLILLLVIFGLNDPYMVAIGSSFILAALGIGVVMKLAHRKINSKILIAWFLTATFSLLITFIILKSLDTVTDRVAVQYGFFENISTLKGLLFPNETLLSPLLSTVLKLGPNSIESHNYLGLIAILFLLSLLPLYVSRYKSWVHSFFTNEQIIIVLAGSFMVLLFSFAFPFRLFADWTTDNLHEVMQFRAPARFAWVFYYGINIAAAKFISDRLEDLRSDRRVTLAIVSLVSIISLWSLEVHKYLSWRSEGNIHHNAFSPNRLAQLKEISERKGLKAEDYHGIFLLPSVHGWTDKVYHGGSWRSNYEGYRLSVASGLPLFNGKLSRMSVSNTLDAMQLVSHPLIERKLLKSLSEDKDIIILKARNHELSEGEEWLANAGTEIYSDDKISILKVSVKKLKNERSQLVNLIAQADSSRDGPLLYEHYDEMEGLAFAGSGGKKIKQSESEIFSFSVDSENWNKKFELSFWYFVDISREGGPSFNLRATNAEGEITEDIKTFALHFIDTQNGWLRAGMNFMIPVGTKKVTLTGRYKFDYLIDELLFKAEHEDIHYEKDGKLYFNNYLIKDIYE